MALIQAFQSPEDITGQARVFATGCGGAGTLVQAAMLAVMMAKVGNLRTLLQCRVPQLGSCGVASQARLARQPKSGRMARPNRPRELLCPRALGGNGTVFEFALSWLRPALPLLLALPLWACANGSYGGIPLVSGAASVELQDLARRAQAGDKHAQLELGIRFEEGRGVPVDRKRGGEAIPDGGEGQRGDSARLRACVRERCTCCNSSPQQGAQNFGLREAASRLARLGGAPR
jgi:hypothetical protein